MPLYLQLLGLMLLTVVLHAAILLDGLRRKTNAASAIATNLVTVGNGDHLG